MHCPVSTSYNTKLYLGKFVVRLACVEAVGLRFETRASGGTEIGASIEEKIKGA